MFDKFVSENYEKLRGDAHALMANESNRHTWKPTELLHETICRLLSKNYVPKNTDPKVARAFVRQAMFHVFVSYVRSKPAPDRKWSLLDDWLEKQTVAISTAFSCNREELLDLPDHLESLKDYKPSYHEVFYLRYAEDLTQQEIADQLSLTERQVRYRLKMAHVYLSQLVKPDREELRP